ncbi:5'-AMP-activated protein kinase subunit beta-2 [Sciurus carolinensis]|uniref:5'-AMP-activated protein kinase subunit beta-2 n=1 Tax=Sciurus carolinensis TaxID=30640 RepID=A0AA41MKQ3_SCICA|nr:5'-AMP-activated protein kinase subunit beta-2 [Sciurus carolinensis]
MGNTTSHQVSGELQGAKAACAESNGGRAPGKKHKIMVRSTSDPSVFSLLDSKVLGFMPPTVAVQLLLGFRTPPPFLGSLTSH